MRESGGKARAGANLFFRADAKRALSQADPARNEHYPWVRVGNNTTPALWL